jgi:hypothetical protein
MSLYGDCIEPSPFKSHVPVIGQSCTIRVYFLSQLLPRLLSASCSSSAIT